LPFVIVDAVSPERVAVARALMIEYRDSISTPLCFQGFDAEMVALPGRYAAPTGCILLASTPADGDVACIALREIAQGPLGRTCEMKRLFVRPSHRGLGIGRAMCEHLISRAVTLGYAAMRLDTDSYMKEAIGLYRSLGFRPIAKYNDDPIPDTLFFELELTSAV
jgi:ribosomal protein S18 acetylase RimI-like enzyme